MKFSYHPYSYPLAKPLITHHGIWSSREGIIITLEDAKGRIGRGEIAPVSWFGSETLSEALAFCQQLPEQVTENLSKEIPSSFPCCQFALESAMFHLDHPLLDENELNFQYTCLLQAGEKALEQLTENAQSYKWKIGVYPIEKEQNIFLDLVQSLAPGCKLRLDANGGLTLAQSRQWLSLLEGYQQIVEFLEQPLAKCEFEAMLQLSKEYNTAIALDESVSGIQQILNSYNRGWRGIYVIKPAIAGSVSKLRQICLDLNLDVVVSTVFETKIGRSMSLYLAKEIANPQRSLGFS